MTSVQVKICGLTRRPDAERAAASGAHYGGVILAPGGRRSIDAATAADLLAELPLRRVGVFVDAALDDLLRAAETAALDVLQLHGAESPAAVEALRARHGSLELWKALRPRSAAELAAQLPDYAGLVDGVLLDGWSEAAPGGTGTRFPWEEMASVRDLVPEGLRLVVAGGLAPDNVGRAIDLLRPAVVDVSSGVEDAPGRKNHDAITAFIAAARGAALDPLSRS